MLNRKKNLNLKQQSFIFIQSGGSITTTYKPCDDDPIPKAMTIINSEFHLNIVSRYYDKF